MQNDSFRMWNREQTKALIHEYSHNECLWNTTSPIYRHRQKRIGKQILQSYLTIYYVRYFVGVVNFFLIKLFPFCFKSLIPIPITVFCVFLGSHSCMSSVSLLLIIRPFIVWCIMYFPIRKCVLLRKYV